MATNECGHGNIRLAELCFSSLLVCPFTTDHSLLPTTRLVVGKPNEKASLLFSRSSIIRKQIVRNVIEEKVGYVWPGCLTADQSARNL